MQEMPRPRPPYLHHEKTRHGRYVWYVRPASGNRPRVRIKAPYGTAEFQAEYQAALSGSSPPAAKAPAINTLAWLIARYRETGSWLQLSLPTRRQRENIFKPILSSSGHEPYRSITEATIVAGRERRASTPAQARNFLDAMRGLFRWAKSAGHVAIDPTAGVKNPKRKKGPGFEKWTEDDAQGYERRWPIGTKERVWLDVLFYTGLRRGDAVRVGKQHVKNGIATLRTEKSGETVAVCLPILPVLARTLAVGPCGDLTFICGERGQPLTKESFGNMFSDAARAAGVKKSAHGVRKIAATRAADNGATVAELNAIFGWSGSSMAELYTREADRKRLSTRSMHMLENTERTSMPAPGDEVRAGKLKE